MAEKEGVKLLGMWASPYSLRIEIALKLKGVRYEHIEEDLDNKSPLILELNPVHKKVPVLVHKAKPIAESLVILEYIDEIWETCPILPHDPYERAMARFWAKFIDEKVSPTAFKAVLGTEAVEREASIKETHELLKFLEEELKGKDFFGGKTFGYVDIAAISIAYWVTSAQEACGIPLIPEEKFPEIYRWISNLSEVDVIKQSIPTKEKLVEYLPARFETVRSASQKAK